MSFFCRLRRKRRQRTGPELAPVPMRHLRGGLRLVQEHISGREGDQVGVGRDSGMQFNREKFGLVLNLKNHSSSLLEMSYIKLRIFLPVYRYKPVQLIYRRTGKSPLYRYTFSQRKIIFDMALIYQCDVPPPPLPFHFSPKSLVYEKYNLKWCFRHTG